jgi:hypothetical protein
MNSSPLTNLQTYLERHLLASNGDGVGAILQVVAARETHQNGTKEGSSSRASLQNTLVVDLGGLLNLKKKRTLRRK